MSPSARIGRPWSHFGDPYSGWGPRGVSMIQISDHKWHSCNLNSISPRVKRVQVKSFCLIPRWWMWDDKEDPVVDGNRFSVLDMRDMTVFVENHAQILNLQYNLDGRTVWEQQFGGFFSSTTSIYSAEECRLHFRYSKLKGQRVSPIR